MTEWGWLVAFLILVALCWSGIAGINYVNRVYPKRDHRSCE